MRTKLWLIITLAVFVTASSGCAMLGKNRELKNQELRNQITVLKVQLENKDSEILSLKENLNKTTQEKETISNKAAKPKVAGEVKSRPNTKQIQTALKNAGYEPGTIDGRMGKQTREALRAFQKANGLVADGKTGKKTWKLLYKYLYQKVK